MHAIVVKLLGISCDSRWWTTNDDSVDEIILKMCMRCALIVLLLHIDLTGNLYCLQCVLFVVVFFILRATFFFSSVFFSSSNHNIVTSCRASTSLFLSSNAIFHVSFLSVTTQLPGSNGYGGGKVVFIDTEVSHP